MNKRLLIVHSAGDFREAWRLREEAGSETYFGHGYILDQLAAMAGEFGEAGYLCGSAPVHDLRLPSGATVMGAGADPYRDPAPVIEAMVRFAPTHLLVAGPMPALLRWGLEQGIEVGCLMADSFHLDPIRRWWRYRWLASVLNDPRVTLVANHGVNAARGLVERGVRSDKVLAWDFPHVRRPEDLPPRTAPAGKGPYKLLYVGSILRSKGVGDLIRAVARLAPAMNLALDIAGAGQSERYARLARKLGVADRVTFLGTVPNAKVPELMRGADTVVVPSRHAFPEGLPLTLFEALSSRTPVIASDHPMFAGHLVDGESALVFRGGSPGALADAVERLARDPALYERLSEGGAIAWQHMQCPDKWGEIIAHWVRGDRAWLADHALSGPLGAGVA